MGDTAGRTLLAETVEYIGQGCLPGGIDKVRGSRPLAVHAHIERAVGLEGKAACRVVDLHGRHADVEHNAVEIKKPALPRRLVEPSKSLLYKTKPPLCFGHEPGSAGNCGRVAIERYVVAYDIGKAVNPMLVEGQIVGGVLQGVGGALYEDFRYDERGEPLSVTFADYLMPTAREAPPVEVIICEDAPSPLNTLGLKGAGEGGANAVGAAVAAAIDAALGVPGAVTDLPMTPQRLREILRPGRLAGSANKSAE